MNEPITPQQDHDCRIGRLEGIAEQLDRRLDGIERRIDSIERALGDLSRRMDSQFRWMVGIQITTLIAIGSLLLSIMSKLPE